VTISERDGAERTDFSSFVRVVEPRLRRALVSRYGVDDGREAAAIALAWGFEHWEDLRSMNNPAGYLYRIGCRQRPRRSRVVFEAPATSEPRVEPALAAALTRLTADQRTAVVLTFAFDWTLVEVADFTGTSISTVNTHRRRGLAKLRRHLGVDLEEAEDDR
jgi:RNA polymerase sigma-70 factor (ECF subfamily)